MRQPSRSHFTKPIGTLSGSKVVENTVSDIDLACIFCEKSRREVLLMVVHPSKKEAVICNECVKVCDEIIMTEFEKMAREYYISKTGKKEV